MEIRADVLQVLHKLEACGHEAYVVGGCVRDSVMGVQPHDWDVCTSALPQEVLACFLGARVVETGLKHGTVTVVAHEGPVEITTYRVDGSYEDNRHPNHVKFVRTLREDLARRDFTINALAYNPKTGLVDYFGGLADIGAKTLRTVGNPAQRLQEDALRILRALRFASRLGFAIDAPLQHALRAQKGLLAAVSPQRLQYELRGILNGKAAEAMLLQYPDILEVFLPEITPMVGFSQNNPHHYLTVWQHTARAVGAAVHNESVRLVMLLHDMGKPGTYSVDSAGVGHFYGHQARSAQLAADILHRLAFCRGEQRDALQLIRLHDEGIKQGDIVKWLARLGPKQLQHLLWVKKADASAKAQPYRGRSINRVDALQRAMDKALQEGACYTLQCLAVTGKDLLAAGVPQGPTIGEVLNRLLNEVMEGKVPNQNAALLAAAKRFVPNKNEAQGQPGQ